MSADGTTHRLGISKHTSNIIQQKKLNTARAMTQILAAPSLHHLAMNQGYKDQFNSKILFKTMRNSQLRSEAVIRRLLRLKKKI